MERIIQSWGISPEWTLFLDRDGVINVNVEADYVRTPQQLHFIPQVPESIATLRQYFKYIIVVTNQQGIGKGLMTQQQLLDLFAYMDAVLKEAGATIDAWYFCPHLAADKCLCRKPKIQMALQAHAQFGGIDFRKAIMIGDRVSDIEFGKKLGMKTVFVTNNLPVTPKNLPLADVICRNLPQFTSALRGIGL